MKVKYYEVQIHLVGENDKFVIRRELTGARITKFVADIISAKSAADIISDTIGEKLAAEFVGVKSTISHLIITNGQTEVLVTVDTEPYRVCIRTVKAHGTIDSEFKYIVSLYKMVKEILKIGVSTFDETSYMCHEVCGVGIIMPDCLSYYLDELSIPKGNEIVGKSTSSLMVTARVQSPLNEVRGITSAEIEWLKQVYDTSCAVQINRYIQKGNSYDYETMPSWYNEYSEPVLYICDWLTNQDFDMVLSQFKQM